jgi:hypothetical protein
MNTQHTKIMRCGKNKTKRKKKNIYIYIYIFNNLTPHLKNYKEKIKLQVNIHDKLRYKIPQQNANRLNSKVY